MTVTFGVEEEFHLVDPAGRVLAADAEKVVAAAAELGVQVNPELQRSAIEVATSVCGTLAELRAEVADRRRAAVAAAGRVGLAVAGAGTLPAPLDLTGGAYQGPRFERKFAV